MQAATALRPWGNSMGIRIPKPILEKVSFTPEDELRIEIYKDMLIIRKKFEHRTFEERLAEYGGNISVSPFDWGEPMGREIL